MRTVGQIIEAAEVNEPTTHDELLYALLAVKALAFFDSTALRHLAFKPNKFRTPASEAEESFQRHKRCFAQDAMVYVGENNDPKLPEVAKRKRAARKLADAMFKDKVFDSSSVPPSETGKP